MSFLDAIYVICPRLPPALYITCRAALLRPSLWLPLLRMRRCPADDLVRDLRHFANVVANKGVAAVLTSLLYFKQK